MKQVSFQTFFKRYAPALIGVLIGALGGYLYYRFVGCRSGACAITGNPVISTLYGGTLGYLIATIITPGAKKEETAHE